MQVEVTVSGIEQAEKALHTLSRKVKDLTPVHREIGNIIANAIEESFEDEASPFGKKWRPSQRVQKHGGKTLTDTGRLAGSFSVHASKSGVTVGTNIIYAAIHHFGGRAGRGGKSRIPARPFLPVDRGARLEDGVKKEILNYIASRLQQPLK